MTKNSLTDLPKHYDHQAAQSRWYPIWQEQGYMHSEPDSSKKPYTIVIPPPNVTGALHLGHALNNTLQDVMIRFKRMQGFNTLWIPGTDHAGIATQAVVERRLLEEENLSRHDLGREKLIERIWQWKEQYETRILNQLQQLGASCDWQRTRFTLDETCARAVRHTFFKMFADHKIYRGKRLVNWDPFLQTAVSDDEVFHETVKGHFWHFHYPVINPKPNEPKFVTIATTRPETMLGDTAVAVHPDPAAALDKVEADLNEKLTAAADKEMPAIEQQIENVQTRRKEMLPQLILLRDMALEGRMLMLPLLNREIPLIADPWAKPELGSGCVKITPAHDANDYEVGLRAKLPMINILNPDGTLNENTGPYQGLKIKEARERVVADLDDAELLYQIEDREIELAHSDRSKTAIEPYLTDQWFVKMDELSQSAMDAVTDDKVKIYPERYRKGYLDWLSEKRDWPVSRQLWWGHQIPIWSKQIATNDEKKALISQLQSDSDVTAGLVAFQFELHPLRQDAAEHEDTISGASKVTLPQGYLHVCILEENRSLEEKYESLGFTRESDVLDTWFSSALWPHSTLGWPEKTAELDYYYPTSALITSRDIITLWVARMVLSGLYNMGDIPFSEVFIHPKILDGYGETMSKSKGNGVDPLDVIDKFGADSLRFGIAHMATETQDVRMPVEFECPHCFATIAQTKKNRVLATVQCKKCNKTFSTQWAESEEDKAHPRGAVLSERFELGRNFCNKLWNASRFSMMNLEGYTPQAVADDELEIEDRWILSRLASVTQEVTEGLNHYKYAEAARALYDFAWDEFCSFYVEMLKDRFNNEASRPVAQRVLAHTLDTLLRLLHPMIPFITEEVWDMLGQVAPQRGLNPTTPSQHVMVAPWPTVDESHQDVQIEKRFARFQAVLGALREIRSRNNIPPKKEIEFSVKCDAQTVELLTPMQPYFLSMAGAKVISLGSEVTPPANSANVGLPGIDVYVDLKGLIDIDAEIARNEKEIENITKMIAGKEKKLGNASFVERATAEVVQREKESLAQLQEQISSIQITLDTLRSQK